MFKFKALMYEHLFIFAAFVPVVFHSQALFVVTFNDFNYPDWSEQVQFHLGVLDLDLALLTKRPTIITDESNAEERSFHKT